MSLRGNGGSGGINRGRRGGGNSNNASGTRIYESKGGHFRSKGGTYADDGHMKLSATPSILTNAKDIGPIKILQSRRNEDPDKKSSVVIAPSSILHPANSSIVPRIAVRPKTENEEKQHQQTLALNGHPPQMPASIRFFDDSNNLNKGFLEYLTAMNSNYNIVAIIGPQGSGKSTFASMLSGNDTGALYGEYIFRPSPREFVEKGASQTTSINVYITKNRTIVFDCQALNSGHIFELAMRSSRREGIKLSQVIKYSEDEIYKLLILLFEISHTIILGIDWFIDLNVIREIMSADLSYRKLKSNYNSTTTRKVNLVVAQLRARSTDFEPELVAERAKMIKGLFEGTRFDVCGGLSMKKLGFDMYSYVDATINYVLFAEIKPRSKLDQNSASEDFIGLLTIPFHEVIKKFALHLLQLPRPPFSQHAGKMNELEWYKTIATSSWEKLFSSELTSFSRK